MKKKNGFISMTLVYTFLILFMFLMLAILRTYTEKDKFLQAINDQIDNDIGVAKGSRITVINRLLEDNMPNSDGNISYYRISNSYYGNGNGFKFPFVCHAHSPFSGGKISRSSPILVIV